MSSEFESVKSEIQELKEAVKALTKTVTENMVKQGEKLEFSSNGKPKLISD